MGLATKSCSSVTLYKKREKDINTTRLNLVQWPTLVVEWRYCTNSYSLATLYKEERE